MKKRLRCTGCSEFKWLTKPVQIRDFTMSSGYLVQHDWEMYVNWEAQNLDGQMHGLNIKLEKGR